ncbi:MAG TPA: hypothetical protein VEI97_09805, partial [bacterium]|nr:hypothetical protein [bacterium]
GGTTHITTTAPRGPALPPPDPEIIRAVTGYKIFAGPTDLQNLEKPLTWFLAGNGLVPVRQTPLGLFVGKGTGPAVPGLPSLLPELRLNCPKLPWEGLVQVVAFFRDISDKIKAEAMVQFFWDPSANGGQGDYIAYVPPQLVSGGGVHHAGHFDPEGKCWHILDIHSHHTMGAFWSATDDADEARFEGRLYGVVGNIDRSIPDIKWRTRVGGAFVDLSLEDVVDLSQAPTVHVEKDIPLADCLKAAGTAKDNTHFTFRFDPFQNATYPDSWRKAVLDLDDLQRRFRKGDRVPACITFTGAGPDADERKELEAMGLVEIEPNKWAVKTLPGGVSHPTSGASGRNSGGTDAGRAGAHARASWAPRQEYVYDRIKGKLYFREAGTGYLYPSYRELKDLEKEAAVTFVEQVNPVLVKARIGMPGVS